MNTVSPCATPAPTDAIAGDLQNASLHPAPSEAAPAAPPSVPPPVVLLQMATGYWVTQSIAVAAQLSIADHIKETPKTAVELAEATGTHAPSLYRLLRFLASTGIFVEDENGRFALTPVAELLRSDVPGSMRDFTILMGHETHWNAWGNFMHSIQTGEPAFDNVFGMGFFEYCPLHPDASEVFNRAMTSLATQTHAAAAAAYDFSGINTLMDVGGGHGALLSSILKSNPHMRGIVFDLAHVVAGAPKTFEQWGVADRCRTEGGDFFEAMPAGADACILSMVIHDWSDDLSLKILQNCHRALPENGKLLLIETVVPEGNTPSASKGLDLNMLVMTNGGRERTAEEFDALFRKAGFELTRILPTQSPMSVIEGVKI
ncbi:MAG: methyltransferase domain-containing protein [Abitibacteriaceae bacterium]|nr:methyltransferase domain-containing protein [Abditibacteriaceae bacterium]